MDLADTIIHLLYKLEVAEHFDLSQAQHMLACWHADTGNSDLKRNLAQALLPLVG